MASGLPDALALRSIVLRYVEAFLESRVERLGVERRRRRRHVRQISDPEPIRSIGREVAGQAEVRRHPT